MGDDPGNPFPFRQSCDPVQGTPELEASGALQAFRLDEDPRAQAVIQFGIVQERCYGRSAGDPPGGGDDVVEGRRRAQSPRIPGRARRLSTSTSGWAGSRSRR